MSQEQLTVSLQVCSVPDTSCLLYVTALCDDKAYCGSCPTIEWASNVA